MPEKSGNDRRVRGETKSVLFYLIADLDDTFFGECTHLDDSNVILAELLEDSLESNPCPDFSPAQKKGINPTFFSSGNSSRRLISILFRTINKGLLVNKTLMLLKRLS